MSLCFPPCSHFVRMFLACPVVSTLREQVIVFERQRAHWAIFNHSHKTPVWGWNRDELLLLE